jgi:hypothetical protein
MTTTTSSPRRKASSSSSPPPSSFRHDRCKRSTKSLSLLQRYKSNGISDKAHGAGVFSWVLILVVSSTFLVTNIPSLSHAFSWTTTTTTTRIRPTTPAVQSTTRPLPSLSQMQYHKVQSKACNTMFRPSSSLPKASTTATIPRGTTTTALWMTATSSTSITDSASTSTTTSSSTSSTVPENPYYLANQIAPVTKPLPESWSLYIQYLLRHFFPKQYDEQLKRQGKKNKATTSKIVPTSADTSISSTTKRPSFWKQLNDQRRNVMNLAGYTQRMIVPSFTFLFLGALMSSIVPAYWGKCIQCVATLSGTKTQLLEALIGLGISSTLAALFTGIRGSLFWIGGTYPCMQKTRVKPFCYKGSSAVSVHDVWGCN